MKAFLLAAGHGTRLKPLTEKLPKCLLPVQGIPLLQIWLDLFRRFDIDEVLINIHSHSDQVRDFLRQHADGTNVHFVVENDLLGSAGTLLANRDWIGSDDAFWVFYADVLNNVDLARMLDLHNARNPTATIAVYRVPDPARCGIVSVTNDGTVGSFVEKPKKPQSNLAFAGLMIGTPSLIGMIPPKCPADLGFDVLPKLLGRMVAYEISEYLLDIGTLENYEIAQRTWPGFDGRHES